MVPNLDDITLDLISTFEAHTKSQPVQPEDLDELAEFTVGWFEQRGLLGRDSAPIVFLLTDHWHSRSVTHGLYGSLLTAKIAARAVVATRGRAPSTGDDWTLAVDADLRRCHRWAPVQLGRPVGHFTIAEIAVT